MNSQNITVCCGLWANAEIGNIWQDQEQVNTENSEACIRLKMTGYKLD